MKTAKSIFICFIILFSCLNQVYSQSRSFEKLFEIELKSAGPIYLNHQVKGYFLFYKHEKISGKNYRYHIEVLDENLNLVFEKEIVGEWDYSLTEAVYCKNSLMVKFFVVNKSLGSSGSDVYNYRLIKFNARGEIKYDDRIDNVTLGYGFEQINSIAIRTKTLFALGDKGFLDLTVSYAKSEIRFISVSPKYESWTYEGLNRKETAEFLGHREDSIFLAFYRKGKGGYAINTELAKIDLRSSQLQVDEMISKEKVSVVMPLPFSNPSYNSTINYFGKYIDFKHRGKASFGGPEKNMRKYNSLFFWQRDENKNRIRPNDLSNTINGKKLDYKDIQKHFPKKPNGDFYDGCLHNIVTSQNGDVYLIYELESKEWEATKKDILLVRLDKHFNVKEVENYEKELKFNKAGSIRFYSNYGDWNKHQPSVYAGFDYRFTVKNQNASGFIVGFLSNASKLKTILSKDQDIDSGLVFSAIVFENDKFTMDQIPLNSTADEVYVLPAKFGYVAVLEYFEEEKKVDIALKRLNY